MSIYPNAQQRLWTPYDPERHITPREFILHTNAVNSHDPGAQGGLSWHFQIDEDGTVYQHRDTGTRAAANYNANDFAISCETWDGGDPEHNPWTDPQVDSIVALILWCHAQHSIPLQIPDTWNGSGVGYHRMYPEWDQPFHSCPGDLRARQFHDVVWPLLTAPDVPPTPPEIDMPAPAVVVNSKGDIVRFVRGVDGQLWSKTGAGKWTPLGGRITSGPAAAVTDNGGIVVDARGEDGADWELTIDAAGKPGAWSTQGGLS